MSLRVDFCYFVKLVSTTKGNSGAHVETQSAHEIGDIKMAPTTQAGLFLFIGY